MDDLIKRADAIEAVRSYFKDRLGKSKCDYDEELQLYVLGKEERTMLTYNKGINDKLRSLPSADAEPKWNCTANFVAEQLERLRNMTDEEKWNFFREFFGMGDAVQGEWKIDEYGIYHCPFCHAINNTVYKSFCPNCGARMKGGDTE